MVRGKDGQGGGADQGCGTRQPGACKHIRGESFKCSWTSNFGNYFIPFPVVFFTFCSNSRLDFKSINTRFTKKVFRQKSFFVNVRMFFKFLLSKGGPYISTIHFGPNFVGPVCNCHSPRQTLKARYF